MRSLDERLFHPLCLTQATLSGSGILGSLAAKLGKACSFRRERNLQLIEQALEELERRILVVVLDEAQNYAHSSLEEVRLLLGLNLPDQPAFALVLIGDEYLLSSFKLRNHRALYSRLACQVALPAWNGSQCAQYLSHALVTAGLSPRCWNRSPPNCWLRPVAACPAASACWLAPPGSMRPVRAFKRLPPSTSKTQCKACLVCRECIPPPRLLESAMSVDPQQIQQAHELYCELTGQKLRLDYLRQRQWYELLHQGFTLVEIRRVIVYLQREIREARRNVGALKLSNLLRPLRGRPQHSQRATPAALCIPFP